MKKDFLFPHSCKKWGWILTVPFAALGILLMIDPVNINVFGIRIFSLYDIMGGYFDELVTVMLIVGLVLVGFSREREEDEYVTLMRGRALTWAVLVNYAIVIVETLLIYDLAYLTAVFIGIFLTLILFIVKFRISMYKFRKSTSHEE